MTLASCLRHSFRKFRASIYLVCSHLHSVLLVMPRAEVTTSSAVHSRIHHGYCSDKLYPWSWQLTSNEQLLCTPAPAARHQPPPHLFFVHTGYMITWTKFALFLVVTFVRSPPFFVSLFDFALKLIISHSVMWHPPPHLNAEPSDHPISLRDWPRLSMCLSLALQFPNFLPKTLWMLGCSLYIVIYSDWSFSVVHLLAFCSLIWPILEPSSRPLSRCYSTDSWLCVAVFFGSTRPRFWGIILDSDHLHDSIRWLPTLLSGSDAKCAIH